MLLPRLIGPLVNQSTLDRRPAEPDVVGILKDCMKHVCVSGKPHSVGSVQTSTNTNKQNSHTAKKSSLGFVMAVCVFVCVVDWEGGAIMLDNQSGASLL